MAEFQKVMDEFNRLCNKLDCLNCPIGDRAARERGSYCCVWVKDHPGEAERIIMGWAAEHPGITNGTKFKEVFGYRFGEKFKTGEDITTWLCDEYKG